MLTSAERLTAFLMAPESVPRLEAGALPSAEAFADLNKVFRYWAPTEDHGCGW